MIVNRCINCMQNIEMDTQICPCCGFDQRDYVQPPHALKTGTILCGRYLVGRVLGQGGFGITYVGYDLKLEILVAVKEYYSAWFASRDGSRSNELSWHFTDTQRQNWQAGVGHFLTEAKKMAKLDGVAGMVRVRDSFERNQTAYIVMDYVQGTPLRQYFMQHGKQNCRQAVKMLLPIMQSLEIMHAKGLIHRDISPDNLMIQKDGRETKVLLLDFGASMDMRRLSEETVPLVVKKGYSAPEQYMQSERPGSFTDVYAMAAVLYFCITGKEVPEAVGRVMDTDELFMKEVKNKKVRDILTRALAVKPEDRIQSMGEFSRELSLAVKGRALAKVAVAAVLCAACGAGTALYATRLWVPSAEVFGTSNSCMYGGANYNEIPKGYEYYADTEWNLHVCKYNEDDGTFYLSESEIVDNESGFINIGRDKVYFLHDNHENPDEEDSVMMMDFDGSSAEAVIHAEYLNYMQYIQSSDGKELLYYLKGDDKDGNEDMLYTLCRYDLEKGTEEELLKEQVYWYNIDGKYIYYNTFVNRNPSEGVVLKRAYLDGKRAETINEKDKFTRGYIEDGTAYLFSGQSEQMLVCQLDGGEWENPFGEYAGHIFDGCSSYGDGWIFYSPSGSGQIHKIRQDGTGDTVIYNGENVLAINYLDEWLWVLTGEPLQDGSYRYDHTLLMDESGSQILTLGSYITEDRLLYKETSKGEVTVTGYLGNEDYVVIPWEFEEGKWNGKVSESFPENVDIYVYAKKSELAYEKTEDGKGIVLNGYEGKETRGREFLAFPRQIDGLPVKEIGDGFFLGNEVIKGIVFPEDLETIGTMAFKDCTSLKWVKLPESLQTVKWDAFYHTRIREITLPAGLEHYYAGAFVEIRKMDVSKENRHFKVKDHVLYRNGSIVQLVLTAKKGNYKIPEDISEIASNAFTSSQITAVTIPGSVKDINSMAFYKSKKLKKAVLQEGVERIREYAFYDCESLSSVTIPESVQTIERSAFKGCGSLENVRVSRRCRIAAGAFSSKVKIHYYD